jgi:hypothetical protein
MNDQYLQNTTRIISTYKYTTQNQQYYKYHRMNGSVLAKYHSEWSVLQYHQNDQYLQTPLRMISTYKYHSEWSLQIPLRMISTYKYQSEWSVLINTTQNDQYLPNTTQNDQTTNTTQNDQYLQI